MGRGNTAVAGHPSSGYLIEETDDMTHFVSNRGFCNPLPTQPSP